MQWAIHCYKKRGGSYIGRKRPSNSMVRWTKQKWTTHDGTPSRGRKRYLPAKAWSALSRDQIRRTNRTKQKGSKRGRQYVRQPDDVRAVVAAYRSPSSASMRRSCSTSPPSPSVPKTLR